VEGKAEVTEDEYTKAYSLVCDQVERNFHGWPIEDNDPWLHTSKEARATALKIFEILGISYE
jgi:hypothetical protein